MNWPFSQCRYAFILLVWNRHIVLFKHMFAAHTLWQNRHLRVWTRLRACSRWHTDVSYVTSTHVNVQVHLSDCVCTLKCPLYTPSSFWSAVNKIHSSPPRYLAASDMTASGVLRPKDLEMVLLSAERESERKTARERVRQLEEGDKGCGGVNKKTE